MSNILRLQSHVADTSSGFTEALEEKHSKTIAYTFVFVIVFLLHFTTLDANCNRGPNCRPNCRHVRVNYNLSDI